MINSLCNQRNESPLPPHECPVELANQFAEYFCHKIDLIRDEIDNIDVNPPTVEPRLPEVKLEQFSPVSVEEVRDTIMHSSNASCQLDPIPTWLLKLCIEELAPVIARMTNLSLQEGCVPDSWKIALIVPLLKKLNLDPAFNNFRPVSNLSFVSKSAERVVVQQLFKHCSENAPLPSNQSAYRKFIMTSS